MISKTDTDDVPATLLFSVPNDPVQQKPSQTRLTGEETEALRHAKVTVSNGTEV